MQEGTVWAILTFEGGVDEVLQPELILDGLRPQIRRICIRRQVAIPAAAHRTVESARCSELKVRGVGAVLSHAVQGV